MNRSIGTTTAWWSALLPVFVGAALSACAGETPASPSGLPEGAPLPSTIIEAAASGAQLSVTPRRLRLKCNQGFPCGAQVVVTSSSPVTLNYFLNGEFIINFGATSCPQSGILSGSCTIGVQVGTTEFPGRRSATLTISESTFGTSRTVRLAARVS
jgi:hypothetical protein